MSRGKYKKALGITSISYRWGSHLLDIVTRGHTNPNGQNSSKPFKWIVADSIVIGLIAFVACMPSSIPTVNELWVMFKGFLGAFVLQLAYERGIKPVYAVYKEKQKAET